MSNPGTSVTTILTQIHDAINTKTAKTDVIWRELQPLLAGQPAVARLVDAILEHVNDLETEVWTLVDQANEAHLTTVTPLLETVRILVETQLAEVKAANKAREVPA
jgi:hypothetical protein